MSAFPTPPPAAPAPSPAQPAAPAPRRSRARVLWIALLIGAAAVAAWLLRPRPEQPRVAAAPGIRTAKAVYGSLQQVARVAGTTTARNFANITAPMMRGPDAGRSLILIQLAKSGSWVKKGDLIAQIDAQSIKDHVDDVDAWVQQSEADIRKRKAEHDIDMENLRQTLRNAKAELDKAHLDFNAKEIRTALDQELLKLQLDEAGAHYGQVQKDLPITRDLHGAQIRILEYTRDRHARHRDRHKTDVTRFALTAPMEGLVVMQTLQRGGDTAQVSEGDQVSPGQPFMKVVDPKNMIVEAQVNQAESEALRPGQHATIRLDAFPGLVMEGSVYSIGAIASGGWRSNSYIRNIPVKVSIKGSDARLIPDLSASADVVVGDTQGVLVPREFIRDQNGKPVVTVKQGDRYTTRAVELGTANHTSQIILAGLQGGEEVVIHAGR